MPRVEFDWVSSTGAPAIVALLLVTIRPARHARAIRNKIAKRAERTLPAFRFTERGLIDDYLEIKLSGSLRNWSKLRKEQLQKLQ
jgi:hypothetical protein